MAMVNGGGKHTVYTAVATDGTVSPLALLYHYDPDTTDTADIYSDQALTSALAQPFVSDAAGRFVFYAKGDFDFVMKDADSVTLDTWDDVHISMGQATVTDYGIAYPTANATNKGHLFTKIVASVLRGVGLNQASSFIEIFKADASGNQILGSVVSKTHPVYDITHEDWGAVSGQASDQSSAIQAAISAIATAGSGVLYIPKGTYQVDSSLDINNCSIKIVGDGAEHSILKQTSDPATPMIDFDSNNQDDKCIIEGLSVTTTVVGSTTGIDVAFTNGGLDDRTNLYINGVYVGPHSSTSATAYFADNILATGTTTSVQKPVITNSMVSGHDSQTSGSNGISISGSDYAKISNNTFQNVDVGLRIDYSNYSTITGNCFRSINKGIFANKATSANAITGNTFEAVVTNGIVFDGAGPIAHYFYTITGNTMRSTDNACVFIESKDIASHNVIVGNLFFGVTGGTSSGVTLATNSDGNLITGNIFRTLDTGIVLAGDDNISTGNRFTSVTTSITDTGSNMQANLPVQLATVASAAALGTGATSEKVSNMWNITGTVNITSIHADVTPWVGRVVTLVFADILTFTDGNNLTLAGNFVTTADDNIRLQYDGTNWLEVSRSIN